MHRRRGFTFIELIVTLTIIASLAAISAVSYIVYVEKARSIEALINIGTIRLAENFYKAGFGNYVGADNADQINVRLSLDIVPKYYEYSVVGVTEDNFIVIARRIGLDVLADYISLASLIIAVDKNGQVANGFGQYIPIPGGPVGGPEGVGEPVGVPGGGGDGGSGGGGSGGGGGGSGGGGGGSGGGGGGSGGGGGGSGGGGGGSGGGGGGITIPSGASSLPGIVYNATIPEVKGLLNSISDTRFTYGDTIKDYMDLIDSVGINIVWADLATEVNITTTGWSISITMGLWDISTKTIFLNEDMQILPGFPPEVISSTLIHEAMHADYSYNSAKWEDRIKTLWPDVGAVTDAALSSGQPDPLRNPSSLVQKVLDSTTNSLVQPLVYTQTEEYFTHMTQAQEWEKYRDRYAGVEGAGILMANNNYANSQKEEDMRASIAANSYYGMLPMFYYYE